VVIVGIVVAINVVPALAFADVGRAGSPRRICDGVLYRRS